MLTGKDIVYTTANNNQSGTGVIHVIDQVLTVPEQGLIIAEHANLSDFIAVAAVDAMDPKIFGISD